jgi:hypothetical protein
MSEPQVIVEPLRGELAELTRLLGTTPETAPVVRDLEAPRRRSDPCAPHCAPASPARRDGAAGVDACARDGRDRHGGRGRHGMELVPVSGEEGDVTEAEAHATMLGFERDRVADLTAQARKAADTIGRVCADATPGTFRGRVRRMVDGRQIELDDGRIFVLVESSSAEQMSDTWHVQIIGSQFSDGTGIVLTAAPDVALPSPPAGGKIQCVRLRIAPVQAFAPYGNKPYLLHDLKAYELGGVYRLDFDARLGASDLLVPEQDTFPRYTLDIKADYIARDSNKPESKTLAWQLEATDDPVSLPFWIDFSKPVTLLVTARVQTCKLSGNPPTPFCSAYTTLSTETYTLDVRMTGSFCTATYTDKEFDVDDQVPDAFRTTSVSGVIALVPSDPGTTPVFVAEGYALCSGGASCFPNVSEISKGEPFAVHNTDFVPIYDLGALVGSDILNLDVQNGLRTAGVSHAPLRWPRVYGKNHGSFFQYACSLPFIVRDVVNFCPGPTNSYYRLPYSYTDLD